MPKRKSVFSDELRQKYSCFKKGHSDFEANKFSCFIVYFFAVRFAEYSLVGWSYPTCMLLADETCPLFGQRKYGRPSLAFRFNRLRRLH